MLEPLLSYRSKLEPGQRNQLDRHGFLLGIIRGFVGTITLSSASSSSSSSSTSSSSTSSLKGRPASGPATISLISRLSWKRAGTRITTRGIDDDGNVANFVESEVIFYMAGITYSHVQLRGSVPVFWEQSGIPPLNTKVQITRPIESSERIFQRHWAQLSLRYGRIHAFNLLGTRGMEHELSSAFQDHANASTKLQIQTAAATIVSTDSPGETKRTMVELESVDLFERPNVTQFDFHSVARQVGGIESMRSEVTKQRMVQETTKTFGFTVLDAEGQYRVYQQGVVRTNCLDCLDRTNVVQDYLSTYALQQFLSYAAPSNPEEFTAAASSTSHPLWSALMRLWGSNGDALSHIYAGTGALNTSFTKTGKKTLGGMLSNAVKSVSRTYMTTFQDKDRQSMIDLLLGQLPYQASVQILDLVHEAIEAELSDRMVEFSTKKQVYVFVGTWNVGGKLALHERIDSWLKPSPQIVPSIFVIGLEEVVELNAQQILMADSSQRMRWEKLLLSTLHKAYGGEGNRKYVVLRSEQLVGTAQLVIVREDLLPYIRAVETDTKKTGLKGMSGNKGGVAVRFHLYDASFCFVVAHLSAGQAQIEERNTDYQTISSSLSFSRGKTVGSHDHIVWLGDFNYRINLPTDLTRQLVLQDEYQTLLESDQLNLARSQNLIFSGLEEGEIRFRPTYKYDVGKDVYDTSEKQRAPAWTDRILYSPDQMKQIVYFRCELRSSDHRPVYSLFQATVNDVDQAKRRTLYYDLLRQLAPRQYQTYVQTQQARTTQSNTVVNAALRAGKPNPNTLPYPSGEDYHWWPDPSPDSDSTAAPSLSSKTNRTNRTNSPVLRTSLASLTDPSSMARVSTELFGTAGGSATSGPPTRRKAPPPPRPTRPGTPPTLQGEKASGTMDTGSLTPTATPGAEAGVGAAAGVATPPSTSATTAHRRPPPPAPSRE